MKRTMALIVFTVFILAYALTGNAPAATQVADHSASVIFFMPVGDPSNPFIHMSEVGIIAASSLFPNLKIARVYPYSDDYIHEYIKFTAMKGHDYIVGIGSYYADAFAKVADEYPNRSFIVIDGKSEKKNVKSITFANYEAGYLAGVVAGALSTQKSVGFIGGRNARPILDFQKGFEDAVKKMNGKITVTSKIIAEGNEGYSDIPAGNRIANEMYKSGCDVLFAAAGASGIGSIDAARTHKKYIIGVDSDQDGLAKGIVATSVIKRLDTAIVNLLQDIATGKFSFDEVSYNVGNVGFTLSNFNYTRDRIGKEKMDLIFDNIFEVKKKYDYSETSKVRKQNKPRREHKEYVPGSVIRK